MTLPLFKSDRGAELSRDGRFRFRLWRRWKPGPVVLWIMLNPSTADADDDDPTVRRCIGFAQRWGYSGILIGNLFALRATNPDRLHVDAHLWGQHAATVTGGVRADRALEAMAEQADMTVVGWGSHGHRYAGRIADVVDIVKPQAVELWQVGKGTSTGQPYHPLMLPYGERLQTWKRAA